MAEKAAPATFNLANLPNERKPFELELVHPGTKAGLGVFLELISVNEPEPKKVTARVQMAANKLARKNTEFTAAQMRQNSIDILAACTTGLRWGKDANGVQADWNGVQLPFTPENVKLILSIDELREQVDAECGDNGTFFRNSI